jgi:type II secretory pathway pseudopilin PulG
MSSLNVRKVPVVVLMILVALSILLIPGAGRADDTATKKAEARRQISQLNDQILALQLIAIPLTEAGISETKAAIAEEEGKANPALGKLIALNVVLAGLEVTKAEEKKELAAKERLLEEWKAYLASLGG